MTISPPDNSFKSSALTSSGLTSAKSPYVLEQERKYKLWQASPEGQAAAAKQAADEVESQVEMREAYLRLGIDYDAILERKANKYNKHHEKHPPHKKTGLLSGLTQKLFKKK